MKQKHETKIFIEHIHKNSLKNLIATLVDDKTISEKDIEEINQIIRKADKYD